MKNTLTKEIRKVIKSLYPDIKGVTEFARGETLIAYSGAGNKVSKSKLLKAFQTKYESWKLVRELCFDGKTNKRIEDVIFFVDKGGNFQGSFKMDVFPGGALIVKYMADYFNEGDKARNYIHKWNRGMEGMIGYERIS